MKFFQPCQLLKAEPLSNGAVEITLKISTEKTDRQDEVVLKSAFANKDTQTSFIHEGLYDYNHLSDILDSKCLNATGSELVELQLQKSRSIIGSPYRDERGLYIENDGVYSKGKLIPDNDFVKEIVKGLKVGIPYGASISGLTLKSKRGSNTIDNIMLKKVAIQPLQESINNETYVQLAKSNIYSLTKILKGQYMDNLETVLKNESLDSKKLNMMYEWFISMPEIQEKIANDIISRLQDKSIPMEYEHIMGHCMNEYAMPEIGAKELANGLLLSIHEEDFC